MRLAALIVTLVALMAPRSNALGRGRASAPPNILLIVADDLGYGELGCQGNRQVPTPNIDAIARHGIRFTNGYVSGPYCSPTRAALLTGRYQQRFGHEFNPSGRERNNPDFGLPVTETTLADRLKAAGYATGMVGKWHLGWAPQYHPLRRGFDEYYGFLGGARAYLDAVEESDEPMLRGDAPVKEFGYTTEAFGREACAFIDRHRKKPWFLYLPFNAVHAPLQATDKYLSRFPETLHPRRRKFAAMLSAMDDAVGEVMGKLRALGLERDTLVVFLSDNGGPTRSTTCSNAPLRGYKAQTWEGGIRVPFLVQWKGHLPDGKVDHRPIIQLDLLPTAMAAAGVPIDPAWKLDGVNLLPYLRGETRGDPHRALYWRLGTQMAIRMGDWKLVKAPGAGAELNENRVVTTTEGAHLYNLARDIGESRNVAAEHPEKVAELSEEWNRWNAELVEPRWFPGRIGDPELANRPPNIVFILADDLGFGDLGCYGQTKIRTPNIDRLAREGMRFTRHYAGNAVCAPSRCVLLTGKHPGHAWVRDNREVEPEGQFPLPAGTETIARMLQERGYATGAFGKWGLGPPGSSGDPLTQGFDRFFGYNCQRQAHNYYPAYLWDNDRRVKLPNRAFSPHQKFPPGKDPNDSANYRPYSGKQYAPDLIAEQARAFVRQNRDRPFFLYFPTTVPHVALQVPDDSLREYAGQFPETPYLGEQNYLPQRTPHAAYAAMITRTDREVGRLVDLVKELGLDGNTVFVFTSDNGPVYERVGGSDEAFFSSGAGLRGLKGSLYEGGVRVPMIVRWTGHVAAGSTSDRLTSFEDWMPTLASIAGAKPGAGTDGASFLPTLLGKQQPERPFLYREFAGYGGQQAVWMGRWKAVRQKLDKGAVRTELYDLEADPRETKDVAGAHPEQVRAAERIMAEQHTPSKEFPMKALDGGSPRATSRAASSRRISAASSPSKSSGGSSPGGRAIRG